MRRQRRKHRRIRRARFRFSRRLEQRTWPTLLALLAWAGVLAAILVAGGGFDAPRPWYNGWVRLIALAAAVATVAWAVRAFFPRRARRFALAAIVSLLVHTVVAVALWRAYLEFGRAPLPPLRILARESSPVRVVVRQLVLDPAADDGRSTPDARSIDVGRPSPPMPSLPRQRESPRDLLAVRRATAVADGAGESARAGSPADRARA